MNPFAYHSHISVLRILSVFVVVVKVAVVLLVVSERSEQIECFRECFFHGSAI